MVDVHPGGHNVFSVYYAHSASWQTVRMRAPSLTVGSNSGPTYFLSFCLTKLSLGLISAHTILQVQFIDAWHQIWKLRQIYFRMQNINSYMGLSVCKKCTIFVKKIPYYISWLSHKAPLKLSCLLYEFIIKFKISPLSITLIEYLWWFHNTWSLVSSLVTQV